MGHPQVRRCFFFTADDEDQKIDIWQEWSRFGKQSFSLSLPMFRVLLFTLLKWFFSRIGSVNLYGRQIDRNQLKFWLLWDQVRLFSWLLNLSWQLIFLFLSIHTGGHTGEMLRLLHTLDFRHFSPRLYLVARTDDMSAQRVQQLESSHVSTADSVNIYIPTRKMCSFSS